MALSNRCFFSSSNSLTLTPLVDLIVSWVDLFHFVISIIRNFEGGDGSDSSRKQSCRCYEVYCSLTKEIEEAETKRKKVKVNRRWSLRHCTMANDYVEVDVCMGKRTQLFNFRFSFVSKLLPKLSSIYQFHFTERFGKLFPFWPVVAFSLNFLFLFGDSSLRRFFLRNFIDKTYFVDVMRSFRMNLFDGLQVSLFVLNVSLCKVSFEKIPLYFMLCCLPSPVPSFKGYNFSCKQKNGDPKSCCSVWAKNKQTEKKVGKIWLWTTFYLKKILLLWSLFKTCREISLTWIAAPPEVGQCLLVAPKHSMNETCFAEDFPSTRTHFMLCLCCSRFS